MGCCRLIEYRAQTVKWTRSSPPPHPSTTHSFSKVRNWCESVCARTRSGQNRGRAPGALLQACAQTRKAPNRSRTVARRERFPTREFPQRPQLAWNDTTHWIRAGRRNVAFKMRPTFLTVRSSHSAEKIFEIESQHGFRRTLSASLFAATWQLLSIVESRRVAVVQLLAQTSNLRADKYSAYV